MFDNLVGEKVARCCTEKRGKNPDSFRASSSTKWARNAGCWNWRMSRLFSHAGDHISFRQCYLHTMNGKIWIGTSGWVYKHWAKSFYPEDLKKTDELIFYTTEFPTVEINATFYRLPAKSMVAGWRQRVPEEFLFAVKGSRYITHMKKLKNLGDGLKKYFQRIGPLKEHLGPILWQLPPNLHKDIPRLERFLKKLPKRFHHAVEFRDPSWIDHETFAVLRDHEVANVWLSSKAMPQDFTVTADFVYLRFHGLKNSAAHDYSEAELKPWAKQLIAAAKSRKSAFVYFNNDLNTRAPLNAKMLMEMVGNSAVKPFLSSAASSRRERIRQDARPDLTIPRSQRLQAR